MPGAFACASEFLHIIAPIGAATGREWLSTIKPRYLRDFGAGQPSIFAGSANTVKVKGALVNASTLKFQNGACFGGVGERGFQLQDDFVGCGIADT